MVKCGQKPEKDNAQNPHRLGSPAEAFPLLYCNSVSKIIQAILKFNLIVSRFKLAKIYTALNKENGASAKAYSSNIFAANGIFIR